MAQSSVMGVITQVMNPETGTSERTGNAWIRQTIIVKKITNSQYESFVALDLNSQKAIEAVRPVVGMIGEFFFDAESRQGQQGDHWFTSLSCYKVKPFQMAVATPEQPQMAAPQNNPQGGWSQPQVQQPQVQQPQMQQPQGGWNQNPQNGNSW